MPSKFKFTPDAGGSMKLRIPAAAMRLSGGAFQLESPIPGWSPPPDAPHNPVSPVPPADPGAALDPGKFDRSRITGPIGVKMKARSGDPIEHPYWGKIIHEMSGMMPLGKKCVFDWSHMGNEDPNHVIGYGDLNGLDLSSPDLIIPGKILATPSRPDDVATEVLCKMAMGVPMQASIDWSGDGTQLEYVDEGFSTTVNGKAFDGPGVVVRKWPLRGAAVCAYGADMNTTTDLDDAGVGADESTMSKKQNRKFCTVSITRFNGATRAKGNLMADNATTSAADGAATLTAQQDTPGATVNINLNGNGTQTAAAPTTAAAAQFSADDYGNAFGDVGYKWHAKGRPFADCAKEFNQAKADEAAKQLKIAQDATAAAVKERDELEKKLGLAPRGNGPASPSADSSAGAGNTLGGGETPSLWKGPRRSHAVDGSKRFYSGGQIAIGGYDSALDINGRSLSGGQPLEVVTKDTIHEKFVVPYYEIQLKRLGHVDYQGQGQN